MKRHSILGVLVGAAALTAAAAAPSAQATTTTTTTTTGTTTACHTTVGSVTSAGAWTASVLTAGNPPTVTKPEVTPGVFPAGKVRLSTEITVEPNVAGDDQYGYVVEGDVLYSRLYNPDAGTDLLTRIGSGWTNFTDLEISHFEQGKSEHFFAYGLRSDGTLFRWNVSGSGWKAAGSATGFSSVKTMALISKTPTYDTFLATTKGGALSTIHIPVTAAMKPVVKSVRSSGWAGIDKLTAEKCGQYGTLVVGIDKDTKTATAYAVGHANGTATVIQSLGKVNGSFADSVYFRRGPVWYLDPINGE